MTPSGGIDITPADVQQVAREAWEGQAKNISSPPLTFDQWWAQRIERGMDQLRALAMGEDPCLCRRGGQSREDCPWKCGFPDVG